MAELIAGTPNNILQSNNDAIAGRSIQLYWCVSMKDSGGVGYALSRDEGVSKPVSTANGGVGSTSYNFDITINKPTIFAGLALVDFKFVVGGTTASISMSVYHWDGASENLISDVPITALEAAGTFTYKLGMAVTRKQFRIGDSLRLKLTNLNSAGGTTTFSHDPLVAGDEMKLWMPQVVLE